jgi:hypothetical protein
VPKIKAVLYSDTTIHHDDFFLNSTDSLHPLHADNIRSHLMKTETDARGSGMRLSNVQGVPTYQEVALEVDKIKVKEKADQAKIEEKMRLAEGTKGSTGVAVSQTLHSAAILSAVMSHSRFDYNSNRMALHQ